MSPRIPLTMSSSTLIASQLYVSKRVFLPLFCGSKKFNHISMQIPLSARLLMPKPAQLRAPGHTFKCQAIQHLPPPYSSVFSKQHQLIAKQEVVNTIPRPALPADPDLRPLLCAFHELCGTRQNPPRGIPRTIQGGKEHANQDAGPQQRSEKPLLSVWELQLPPNTHTNPATENRSR